LSTASSFTFPRFVSTMVVPFSVTVIRRPFAVISSEFHPHGLLEAPLRRHHLLVRLC
jgi:hypothetical protein